MALPATTPPSNRALLIKITLALVVAGVGGLLILRGLDVKSLIAQGLELIRGAGPLVFFSAMAVLPAFGAPLLAFTLSAAPVFAPTMGLGWVIVASLASIAVNIALTYWLAAQALRPLLSSLLQRLGYQLPAVAAGDFWDVCILLRVTPGIPFFAQGYLLGLARVPFRIYMLSSVAIAWAYGVAFVVFGDSLLKGKGKTVLLALSGLAALSVGTQLLRKHYAKKKVAP